MNQDHQTLQTTLGGAVCGSFSGIFAGGLLGGLCELLLHNNSAGLDGALLGCGAGFVGGAAYGLCLHIRIGLRGSPPPPAEIAVDGERHAGGPRPAVETRPVLR